MPIPESESKNAKEIAGMLVNDLLAKFTEQHLDQLRRGERGRVEVDLAALIDRSIGVVKTEEGVELAREVAERFADEIEFCSAAFQDFAEIAKDAVKDAEIKYGIANEKETLEKAA
jgi:hypothetical protein